MDKEVAKGEKNMDFFEWGQSIRRAERDRKLTEMFNCHNTNKVRAIAIQLVDDNYGDNEIVKPVLKAVDLVMAQGSLEKSLQFARELLDRAKEVEKKRLVVSINYNLEGKLMDKIEYLEDLERSMPAKTPSFVSRLGSLIFK